MKDLHDYFDPVTFGADPHQHVNGSFGSLVQKNLQDQDFPDYEKADIAIIGISEYRNIRRENSPEAATHARKNLYELSAVNNKMKIADLGNLRTGHNINDSYAALRDIMAAILEKNTIPLLLGGSKEIILGMFRAYEAGKKTVNVTMIDNRPGLADSRFDDRKEQSFLSTVISSKSKYLFNYSNIGYQSYFSDIDETRLLDDLLFDSFRLGKVRENLQEMEPVIRDTDLMVISMSSIRQADAPAAIFPSPNGFFGEEVCQLAWYGGKSERLTSLAICDWYPEFDMRFNTALQAAQLAWYFADGFYRRKNEYPFTPSKDCTKYIVNLSKPDTRIVFYKSNISERWWMEVPSSMLPQNLMVACSYEDYQGACRQEVPERWWQTFKKINH